MAAGLARRQRWQHGGGCGGSAAYAVHKDCRGHTGAGISFGQGIALSYSWKQKINTKSSTEAELVGVDDALGYILWACYYMLHAKAGIRYGSISDLSGQHECYPA